MRNNIWTVCTLTAVFALACGADSRDEGMGGDGLTGTGYGDDGGDDGGSDTDGGDDGETGGGGTGGGDDDDGDDGDPPETCPGVSGSTLPLTPGDHLGLQLEFDGVMRSFGLQVPQGYDTSKCNPAIVFLHGTHPGPTERDVQATYMGGSGWPTIAAQHKFLVAYPVGTIYPEYNAYGFYTRTQQEQVDHHRWIDTVRDVLVQQGAVDPNRVFIMGFSTGAFASSESLVMSGDKYAAYGVHGGGAHPNLNYAVPPEGRGMYIFIGTGDTNHYMYSKTLVDELRQGGWTDGVDLIYNERQGWGHQYDATLNAEQWAFFTQFSLAWEGPNAPRNSERPMPTLRADQPAANGDPRTAVVRYEQ